MDFIDFLKTAQYCIQWKYIKGDVKEKINHKKKYNNKILAK